MSEMNWRRIEDRKLWGVDIPSGIDFYENLIEKQLRIHINYPERNMQEDTAAFEAWALIFYIKKQYEITLSFKKINWDGSFLNLCREQTHYMRFLYRVWKFNEQMSWFHVEENTQEVVKQFKDKFTYLKKNKEIVNNIPKSEARLSNSKKHKIEHYVENALVADGISIIRNKIEQKSESTIFFNAFNQLPNGLFKGKSCNDIIEKNRIFPTGFFDIWGIGKDNELCVIELKAFDKEENSNSKNKKVGIISELFFYANYCEDIFYDKNFCSISVQFRGYKYLVDAANKGLTKIKAFFLSPEYHPEISNHRDLIKKYLNNKKGSSVIEYEFLDYSYHEVRPFVEQLINKK